MKPGCKYTFLSWSDSVGSCDTTSEGGAAWHRGEGGAGCSQPHPLWSSGGKLVTTCEVTSTSCTPRSSLPQWHMPSHLSGSTWHCFVNRHSDFATDEEEAQPLEQHRHLNA